VLGGYVSLQPAGRHFKALCPFHTERTPSFIVSPERQTWHCFGRCGTGGDVFAFVMRREGVEFPEALRRLATQAGVAVTVPGERKAEEGQHQRLCAANAAAAQYYHHLLLTAPWGEAARRYVLQRGLTEATVQGFLLGLSPPGWDDAVRYLSSRGYAQELLVAAGLATETARGTGDRFRSRLMIPIRNLKGETVGFGARALDDAEPKYLNTAATAVFEKGSLLYGLDRAGEAMRRADRAVVVEGYLDVLVAHQHGFDNVVAVLGTALGERHLELLRRFSGIVLLALDADAAGQEAVRRGLEASRRFRSSEFLVPSSWSSPEPGTRNSEPRTRNQERRKPLRLGVLQLPWGRDPDEVILESPTEWVRLVEAAIPAEEFLFEHSLAGLNLRATEGRRTAVERLRPVFDDLRDPATRDEYVRRAANRLGIGERVLASLLFRPRRGGSMRTGGGADDRVLLPSDDPLEEHTLALLIQHAELRPLAANVREEHFTRSEMRALYTWWQAEASSTEPPGEETLRELYDGLAARSLPPAPPSRRERELLDCADKLEKVSVRRGMAAREALLREIEGEEDPSELARAAMAVHLGGAGPGGLAAEYAALQQENVAAAAQLSSLFRKRTGP
ncbi:MAG: DNA primase, partial [Chloroflexi bacterium]|nr:DNA primase [Chloroflexota bacterium]